MGRARRPRRIAHVAGCHRPAGLGYAHVGPRGVEPRSGLLGSPRRSTVDGHIRFKDISIIVDVSPYGSVHEAPNPAPNRQKVAPLRPRFASSATRVTAGNGARR